jgi:hypothetical protein
VSWADLNPLKRAKKPTATGKVYIGADHIQPHAGLAVFAEARPESGSFCVEGHLGSLKAEFCGKLLDWANMPPRYLASLKTGGSVSLPLEKFKALIK